MPTTRIARVKFRQSDSPFQYNETGHETRSKGIESFEVFEAQKPAQIARKKGQTHTNGPQPSPQEFVTIKGKDIRSTGSMIGDVR